MADLVYKILKKDIEEFYDEYLSSFVDKDKFFKQEKLNFEIYETYYYIYIEDNNEYYGFIVPGIFDEVYYISKK